MNSLGEILSPLIEEIGRGRKTVEVSGLSGASRALFLCGLEREVRRTVIALAATPEESERLLADVRFFAGHPSFSSGPERDGGRSVPSRLFPPWGLLPFEADSPDSGTVGLRMRFLHDLTAGQDGIFILPIRSLIQKLLPWDRFAGSVVTVRPGSPLEPGRFLQMLSGSGYDAASLVTRVGEFSRRGGIIDLFSPAHDAPVRIELLGDVVESLREFDPETQRSTRSIEEAIVLPVRELIVLPEDLGAIRDEALGQEVREGVLPPGIEFLAPFLYTLDAFFRYLPENALVVCFEPDDIEKQVSLERARIEAGREEEAAEGRTLPETAELYLSDDELETGFGRFPRVNVRLLGTPPESRVLETRSAAWLGVRLGRAPADGGEGTVPALVEKLRSWRNSNRIVIAAGTEESQRRIMRLLGEYGCATTTEIPALPQGESPLLPVSVVTGKISAGFSWPALNLLVIAEEDLFGVKTHRPRAAAAKASPFLSSFRELKPGDYVVHRDYGVGEYLGLTHLSVDGFETDFLALRYEPDAKLYVPLHSLDKVQKYVGTEGISPKLNRLGAPAWARTKEKARKDILEMARELAALYAAREAMERKPFTEPDNLYREFESAFPYEETPDQEKAIEDVLADMQKRRPMDRLVCGDVGYGKTEVALRAAFKAVEDGSQVAILAPTTLLADQHYRTFTERLSPFSIRVEMLSRFRSKALQKETLRGLRNGAVDIVIGTHRLLQKDVSFRNLGLLVVDEEHRFGVRHKERIKEFRKLVDALALTATPIPRTLHFSLSGLRDLSVIQTPPLDRQSIQVALARFGKRVIREAIVAELGRGGQVFFVQNRVQGIERMADFVRTLAPEARVGVAHGQMKEDMIENVMTQFIAGRLNVLVTTAIIESGIDIPNANTIIINRADRFGLAELYQIKGRVGRGRRKAYAYLLTPEDELLSDAARTRLRAIQELSELGAGFRIAAQDLETRGAGNLLGKQQSGHIAAVGIDLYTEMMEEAMAGLTGREIAAAPDTQINLRASAFIPEDYLADVSLRLAAYKEISGAADDDELGRIAEDLADRYGPLPEPLGNLLEIMRIKIVARESRVARIDGGAAFVHITFAEDAGVPAEKVMALLKKNKGSIKLIPEYTLQVALPDPSLPAAAAAVKKCLQELR